MQVSYRNNMLGLPNQITGILWLAATYAHVQIWSRMISYLANMT